MPRLQITCPLNSLGYGVASIGLCKELDCNIYPIGQSDIPEKYQHNLLPKIERGFLLQNRDLPSLRIYHQFDLAHHIGKNIHIGFPIFELDNFNPREIAHIQANDIIFVCSNWAKNIVQENVAKHVEVIPLGVDRDVFHENVKPSHTRHKFTFLNVGKWEKRKRHDILYKSFARAFSNKNDVRLIMCCDNPFLSPSQTEEWKNLYRRSLGNKVEFVSRMKTQEELASLMAIADCGVFPSRAEGWNLELLEMMSMGKMVISTNYSAHTEFANKNNCQLLSVTRLEKAIDNIWFHGQGNWMSIEEKEINELADLMLDVYNNSYVNKEGIETAKQFSWSNSAKKILDIIH